MYYQSPRNPNLIAIVPVDEPAPPQQTRTVSPIEVEKTETHAESYSPGRFNVFIYTYIVYVRKIYHVTSVNTTYLNYIVA